MELYRKEQHRLCTTVDKIDYIYCKSNNIKFSHLIRAGVRDHKVNTDHPDAERTMREMRDKIEKMSIQRNKIFESLNKRLTEKEMMDFIQNLNL